MLATNKKGRGNNVESGTSSYSLYHGNVSVPQFRFLNLQTTVHNSL